MLDKHPENCVLKVTEIIVIKYSKVSLIVIIECMMNNKMVLVVISQCMEYLCQPSS